MRLGLIGWSTGLGEELLRYNWSVGNMINTPCLCRKLIPNITRKRIFLVTKICTSDALSSIAKGSEVRFSTIRGLSSAPETENCIGCSDWTKDSKWCNCLSKRLIEESVSIKIVVGLLSKVTDTRRYWSCKTWFWMILLSIVGVLVWNVRSSGRYLLFVKSADENGSRSEGLI